MIILKNTMETNYEREQRNQTVEEWRAECEQRHKESKRQLNKERREKRKAKRAKEEQEERVKEAQRVFDQEQKRRRVEAASEEKEKCRKSHKGQNCHGLMSFGYCPYTGVPKSAPFICQVTKDHDKKFCTECSNYVLHEAGDSHHRLQSIVPKCGHGLCSVCVAAIEEKWDAQHGIMKTGCDDYARGHCRCCQTYECEVCGEVMPWGDLRFAPKLPLLEDPLFTKSDEPTRDQIIACVKACLNRPFLE